MKMCGEVEVIIALTHSTGSMIAPRAGLDGMKKKIPLPVPESQSPISLFLSPHLGTRSICGAMLPVPHMSS